MSTSLPQLLQELKNLQSKIEIKMKTSKNLDYISKMRNKIFPKQEYELIKFNDVEFDSTYCEAFCYYDVDNDGGNLPYYLLTITFSPDVVRGVTHDDQRTKLLCCLDLLKPYKYFACLEKHKSGILHAHVLLICDHYQIQPTLHIMKKKVTHSVHLEPAINMKVIKPGLTNFIRSLKYIVDDKPDHPKYKHLQYNF